MLTPVPLPLRTGLSLWVDSIYGVDATGRRGIADLPFKTLTAAKAAALAGDTIVVRPGTFDEVDLLKNGVNWHFEAGAVVDYTGTADTSIFNDDAGPVVCRITGAGQFKWRGTTANSFTNEDVLTPHHVIRITNAGSNVILDADSAYIEWNLNTNNQFSAIRQNAGRLTVRAVDITATRSVSNGAARGVWWNGGELSVSVAKIAASVNAFYCKSISGTEVGNAYLTAHLIDSAANPPLNSAGLIRVDGLENYGLVTWIIAKEVRTGAKYSTAKNYLFAEKVSAASGTFTLHSDGFAQTWATVQKLTIAGNLNNVTLNHTITATQAGAWVRIEHVEITALTTTAAFVSYYGRLHVGVMNLFETSSSTEQVGVQITGTESEFSGMIDARPAPNGGTPLKWGNGTVRDGVFMAPDGRFSIKPVGASASVLARGTIRVNQPIDPTLIIRNETTPVRHMLTPTQITADQNDYAPGVTNYYRLSTDASRTITGLVAGADGEPRHIVNVGAQNIVLAHESASSTAANRFLMPTGANVTITPNGMVGMVYDATSARWRVFA